MTTIVKAKHQRLVLALVAGVVMLLAGLAAAWGLRAQASYFYLPAQLLADPPEADRSIRLGGMVETGSLRTAADGVTVNFVVFDGEGARVPVRYSGILPDLFVEGSGVVADGKLRGGVFVADSLLAKHDENYVPRELEDMTEEQARAAVMATKPQPRAEAAAQAQ